MKAVKMAANISVSAASSLEENAVACKAGKSIARKKKKKKRRAVVSQNNQSAKWRQHRYENREIISA
jgi:hypothetical protein